MNYWFVTSLCAAISLISSPLMSEQASDSKPKEEKGQKKEPPKEETITTTHAITINGVDTPYKAIVGTQLLKDDKGDPKASIFYLAYVKEGVENQKTRPVTFCFNGGPGSSSVWLNLGIFGPKRISIDDDGMAFKYPLQLLENPYSILDITDLVFIDPVSTGYSRPVPGEDAKQFHGVDEDVQSVAEFIRLYTTRNELWESPKFLAGESYGTTRAAALASELHDKQYLYLDGILLISTILDFGLISNSSAAGNDLTYLCYLPSYTAAAFYHRKLPPDLQDSLSDTLAKVEGFVYNEYTQALFRGDNLGEDRRKVIVDKLSRYTGISKEYIDMSDLRMNMLRFTKELMRKERRTIGRFDSRVKGISSDPCGSSMDFDPSMEIILGPFTAAFNEYVRSELNWKIDDEYKILTSVWPWNYGDACRQSLNVSDKLKEVMEKDPALEVYVASGYYDLAIPYFSVEYTLSHLGLEPSLRSNITSRNYEGGHMMYLYKPTLVKMKEDISQFIQQRIRKQLPATAARAKKP